MTQRSQMAQPCQYVKVGSCVSLEAGNVLGGDGGRSLSCNQWVRPLLCLYRSSCPWANGHNAENQTHDSPLKTCHEENKSLAVLCG